MLTAEYRPKSFAEVVGQELPKRLLSSMAKNPAISPRSVVLSGGRGLGKTTTARIFGRAANCERHDGDCCNQCAMCKSIKAGNPLYVELDSAIVGNVDTMRGLRDVFGSSVSNGWRVVVLDEVHLVSKAAQGALLTMLEEAPPGVFFVLATTNKEMLLPTIISRSLELTYEVLTGPQMVSLLRGVADREKISCSDRTLEIVGRRVKGHARDGMQQLEKVRILGEETYLTEVKLLDDQLSRLFSMYAGGEKAKAKALVVEIVSSPVDHIEQDFDEVVKAMADSVFLEQKEDKRTRDIVMFYLRYHRFVKTTNDWYLFLTSMATLFEEKKPTTANRFQKVQ